MLLRPILLETKKHKPFPFSPLPQVIGEMRAGLADWEAMKRWDTLGISAQVRGGLWGLAMV